MKKKVLIFNGYYVPAKNYGGPLTSILNVVNTCSDNFIFYIVSCNHDFNSSEPFNVEMDKWLTVGLAQVMYVKGNRLNYSRKEMNILIETVHPDLVWFTGVLTPQKKIIGTIVSKKHKIPVLFSPRGELDKDRVKIKGYKKYPYLFLLKLFGLYNNCYFHVTSNDEREGVKIFFSPLKTNIFYVPNIALIKQKRIKKDEKKKGVAQVFFMSRIHPVKNLLYAIESIAKCKNTIIFDIYGPIEDKEYWNTCQELISKLDSNICVQYKGYLNRDDMPNVVQQYDCLLFPTINENYGHVIAESLANSCPVIISKGTTPWDDIDGKAGFAISLSNQNEFTEKLEYIASLNNKEYKALVDKTSDYFDKCPLINDAIEGHTKMLSSIIERQL